MGDEKLDRALTELARLHKENPEVVDDVVAFIMERNHTATIELRFHNHKLVCADFHKVSRAAS